MAPAGPELTGTLAEVKHLYPYTQQNSEFYLANICMNCKSPPASSGSPGHYKRRLLITEHHLRAAGDGLCFSKRCLR